MPVQRGTGSPRGRRLSDGVPTPRNGSPLRWVPVSSLTPLARALLSEDLGGREEVPPHVADRVSQEATRWAAHGFTTETVRPWLDLPPAAAAYLAERGVPPRVLDLPVEVSRSPVTLTLAISSGLLPVERAYQLLVATGEHLIPTAQARRVPAGEWPTAVVPRPGSAAAPVPGPLGMPAWSGPAEPEPGAEWGRGPRRPVSRVVFSHAPGTEREPAEGR